MADPAPRPIRFRFEERDLTAAPGQSLAAALIAAGERAFRHTASGAPRSLFCGMGVCQDCLVEVDGLPGRRACMTAPRPGMTVRRQPARVRLAGVAPAAAGSARVEAPDLLVIGGGAGGLSAAIAAAQAGVAVTLIDERSTAGGQFYKQSAAAPPLDRQQRDGAALIAAARAAGVDLRSGVEVWGAFEGPLLLASVEADALVLTPRLLVVATGAYERPVLVPGWERPGVMTTGAAQTLWRSHRTLPGERVVVAGSGPLNAQVALELARGGAEVTLVEAAPAPWRRPGIATRMAAAGPRLAASGAGLLAGLARRRVPLRFSTALRRVEATGDGRLAVHLSAGPPLSADAVLMNDGFHPANEILRLLGVAMDWDGRQLRPRRSASGETSVAGVWAVGDCCGLGGAPAAAAEGTVAGSAAARRLGFAAPEPRAAQRALARARRFQHRLWPLYAAPAPAAPPPETLLCRCEEVSVASLDAAVAAGAGDIGAAKRATRIGMGRCQGRYCGPALAALMAERQRRTMDERAFFAPRPPVKPVAIAQVLAAEAALASLGPAGAAAATAGPPDDAPERT